EGPGRVGRRFVPTQRLRRGDALVATLGGVQLTVGKEPEVRVIGDLQHLLITQDEVQLLLTTPGRSSPTVVEADTDLLDGALQVLCRSRQDEGIAGHTA